MLGLFTKTSPIKKLERQYKQLLQESHQLSTTNRKASDAKIAQANEILEKITELKKKESK